MPALVSPVTITPNPSFERTAEGGRSISTLDPELRQSMAHDKNVSPFGWYLGSYLLRFVKLEDKQRDDPEARFLSWENTVLVKAASLDGAYSKVERIAKQATKPYRGGSKGVPVRWEYVGVTQLLPIYEELADGAEIAWAEHSPRKLKSLRQWVKPKKSFHQ